MKIFLIAYIKKNLGDDLFIKILLEKYKQCDFYILNNNDYLEYFNKYNNLHIIEGKCSASEICSTNVDDYDAFVYIGGSIFIENKSSVSHEFNNFLKRCKEKNKPFYYISSNFGPFETTEFLTLSKKIFANCTDICFRDTYSYNLFKDLDTVRYAPDIVFSANFKTLPKVKNTLGISVINLKDRSDLKHIDSAYYNYLLNNIKEFIKEGKKVYLFSFCKSQGDEDMIDKILSNFDDSSKLTACNYDGDIDKFIELYSSMEYMICTRFHSMVLSSIFRQKVFVLSYSNKIDNVYNNLKLGYNLLHIEDIDESKLLTDNCFKVVDENKLSNIKSESEKQLSAFDKFVKGK